MRKAVVWFYMLSKRQLKKVSLYIILAVLTVACLLIRYAADSFSAAVVIGVVNEDGGNVSSRIEENLYSHRGIIVFKRFDTSEELKRSVRSGETLGGYILRDNFGERLLAGSSNDIIQSLSTPNNIVSGVANEIFFSFVMKEVSYEELVKDTEDTGLFTRLSDEEIRAELREYYDINLSNGSTFSLDYDRDMSEYEGKSISIDTYDYISPIIAGIVGLMVFLGGLCGTVNCYDDRKNGSFSLLRPVQRQFAAVVETAVPVYTVTAAGLLILAVTGMETDMAAAAGKYALYGVIVTAYCFALKCVIATKEVYVSFIPVLMLLSLVLCPVFVNISSMLPELSSVGKILPLYWLYAL